MKGLPDLTREELLQIIREQQRVIEELKREVERLKKKLAAAPFSRGVRKANPKRPGRKPGKGPFCHREAPPAESCPEPIPVPAPLGCCPECGGELSEGRTALVTVTDLPERAQPEVRGYLVETRHCLRCGKAVRGRHPQVAADQHGATAHRLGPRVKALAHTLHYGLGVPTQKVPAILQELGGLRVTQSALSQDAQKQAGGSLGAAYQRLRAGVKEACVVHTDDTGWRVGGRAAHLMVFDTTAATVYQIRPQHRNEEVRELVPGDFAGTLVCDRGKSYEAEELRSIDQQKCLAHLLRNASEVAVSKTGRARDFSLRLQELLRQALDLAERRPRLKAAAFQQQAHRVETRLTDHLRDRLLCDNDNQRLLNGVGIQHDRGHLLRFLHDPRIEPTNNRAERALRPAVIQRKVSHCSKTDRGAHTFEVFLTVIQTLRKQGQVAVSDGLRHSHTALPSIGSP